MKTKDVLSILLKSFSGYTFHKKFMDELVELLKTDLKGKESVFFKCLTTQLNHIKTFGMLINKVDSHEIIKGLDGHYFSIHLKQSQFNVRFLTHISNNGIPTFLCAFYEREGHKKTSYQNYTPTLEQRFKELQGVDSDE